MAKTKIVANYLRKAINEDGNLEVTFEVSNYHYKRYCQDLQKKPYTLEIAEVKNKRSINQNNFLWALIHEITQHPNASSDDDWDMYCILLSMTDAKYEYITCLAEALETLKQEVRALQVLGYENRENGTRWA
ncbi:hypothetical protein, partial [Longicatena caecimuris]|uniref:hypothetical protein n=1 Tax=Longicatena caecimuris TaxID=1796635 RepID=UPI00399B1E9F